MIRVLHLIEKCADYQSEVGAMQLSGDRSGSFTVAARTIGCHGDFSTVLGGVLWMRQRDEPLDLIHAWGQRALSIGVMGTRARVVYSPTRFPSGREIRWLRAVMSARDLQVVCHTDTMRRVFVEHAIPIERCHLIRPAVDFSQVRPKRNPALRAALGFSDDDYVMLAAGESTREAAHEQAVWAGSILHVLDPKYRLLLWGRGAMADKAIRFAVKTRQATLLEVATRRLGRSIAFEELLGAADMAIVTARGPVATLPISICMAAGLPIVAIVTRTVAELLEDRHTALMVGKAAPRVVAQRILDLRADASLQWSIADMARTEAYEYFSLTRFLQQYRTLYGQVAAGERVEIPQQPPGAGLRFHGRA